MLNFQEIFVLRRLNMVFVTLKMEISLSVWYLTSFYLPIENSVVFLFQFYTLILSFRHSELPVQVSTIISKMIISRLARPSLQAGQIARTMSTKVEKMKERVVKSKSSLLRNLQLGPILFHDKKGWKCAAWAWNAKTNVENSRIGSGGLDFFLPVI